MPAGCTGVATATGGSNGAVSGMLRPMTTGTRFDRPGADDGVRRRSWRSAVLVYGPLLLVLAAITWVVRDGVVVRIGGDEVLLRLADLVQEPAAAGGLPPYTGVLSTLGGVLMCAAGAVAVVAGAAAGTGSRLAGFLVEVGALTVVLGLDDLLQLHEAVVPGLTGLPEEAVFGLYGVAAAVVVARHQRVLGSLATVLPVVAVGLLAASVGLDVLDPPLRWRAWTEDSVKLLGIAGWSTSLVTWALAAGRTASRRRADPRADDERHVSARSRSHPDEPVDRCTPSRAG